MDETTSTATHAHRSIFAAALCNLAQYPNNAMLRQLRLAQYNLGHAAVRRILTHRRLEQTSDNIMRPALFILAFMVP